MKRKILLLPILLILFVYSTASADTISDLKAQLQAVLDRIDLLKAELLAIESGGSNASPSCLNINTNLRLGMQSQQVQDLQVFLSKDPSIYPEGITSGYFGRLTEKAVQRWQAKYGVINYGTAATTGYGAVGPKTRSAMMASCTSDPVAPGADNVIDFAFTTPSGQAPYDSVAKLIVLESQCMSYKIDWGDGTEPTTYSAPSTTNCGTGLTTRTLLHTYTEMGNYTATLYAGKGVISTLPQVKQTYIAISQGAPIVKILSPTTGDILKLGDKTNISWRVSNQPDDSAVVFYILTQSGAYKFAKLSKGYNSFSWLVGDSVCDGNSCAVSLDPGSNYKIRAVLYTPASACVDFCSVQDTLPTLLSTDETGPFTISQLGTGGSNPISISNTTGNAPYTTKIDIKIEPTNTAVGNFELDFGDGTPKYNILIPVGETRITERTIYHTFTNPGTYKVSLRPAGAWQTVGEQTVTVSEWPFDISPDSSVYAPATVQATINVDTTCINTSNTSRIYTIDWGDNTETSRHEQVLSQCSDIPPNQTSTTKVFKHDYMSPGSYNISLTTRVGNTDRHITKKQISLKKPTVSVSPRFGFKPLTIKAEFIADESCVVESTSALYTIDWGDGTSDQYNITPPICTSDFAYTPVTKSFTHRYSSIGRYNVSLTLDKTGVGSIKTSNIEVVVDTSVLRNGWRRLVEVIDASTSSMAAAIQSLF
jgi:hypothetical protein